MEYRGYKGSVEFNAEDRIWHGRVQNIGDMVLYESESEFELAQRFRQTIDEYITFCLSEGRKPDAPLTLTGISSDPGNLPS